MNTQTQSAPGAAASREEVSTSFKRFILEESSDFASEPMADLYRVGLLGQMLDCYDEAIAGGMSAERAAERVYREFGNIPQRMREEGFESAQGYGKARWPQMSEDEVAQYVRESSEVLHRRSLGTALCSACCFPMMIGAAFTEMWRMYIGAFLGMAGMFGMIGMGVYLLTATRKPKGQDKVKKGHFSLSARVRKKLRELREAIDEKASRRRGKGIAMLSTCVLPIFVGAMLDSMWGSKFWAIIGVAGMFAMIGAGVYEVVMAAGEKKNIRDLLRELEE